ncbi:probable G-protein coupled receptor 19 [Cololabis saira]|uniref:probable G-protein coupled receptor 19 n=1 Tax=Cololabis saira TaxID=129043 RepID=UPI002AD4E4BF|nr:probable G-protein coupled receptor 19 [Cololabis saira]
MVLAPPTNRSDSAPFAPPPTPRHMSFNSSVPASLPSSPLGGGGAAQPNGTASPALLAAGELAAGELAALGVAFALLWLVSVVGNALVVLVIHRSRRAQSTTNYFVAALACADLLLSLGCAPLALLQVAAAGRWPLGGAACRAVRFLQHLCPGVQVHVLLSIAVDRFYTIVHPLSFKVSRETAKRMIAASWLLDAALAAPCVVLYGGASSASSGGCDYFLPSDGWAGVTYAAVQLLAGFLAPAALAASFYQRVVRHVWRVGADGRSLRRTTNVVPRTKVKTIQMFLVLNGVFFLSWAPFYAAQLWRPAGPDPRYSRRRELMLFAAVAWTCLGSAASKPTLYSVFNANFRRGMRETFCSSSMKCYRSNAYTITASSRVAKKNHVGVVDLPAPAKAARDEKYDAFGRDAKEKKLAWPSSGSANPPNTFV